MIGSPTTVILLRHGVTPLTEAGRFSGRGGSDPEMSPAGVEQVERAVDWICENHGVAAIVSSPLRRARQAAELLAGPTGLDVAIDDDLVEASFGDWEGLTFADIMAGWPTELNTWLDSSAAHPPGGESLDGVDARVAAARNRTLEEHDGTTVVLVCHASPIKMLLRQALDAPMTAFHTLVVPPASISTVRWFPDGNQAVLNVSVTP